MRTRLFWLMTLVVALFVAGCGPGAADYGYQVAGGYVLDRSSGHQIKPRNPNNPDCGSPPDNFDEQRRAAWSRDCYEEPDGVFHYWILDTSVQKSFGQYDRQAFDAQRQALGIPDALQMKAPDDYIDDLCGGDRSAPKCQQ